MLLKMTLGFFTLYCLFAVNYGLSDGRETRVEEGSDAVLRCSLGNQDLRPDRFHWVKDDVNDRKTAFGYVQGKHSNDGLNDQHQHFKGRVSHFRDELQHSNASIKIHNTKMEDSGDYICSSDRHEQIFRVQLVVDGILKDRSGSPGVAPAPDITIVNATNDWWQLQCDVRGASSKPKVEWQNSDGKVLHSQEPEVTESEGRFNVTLLITVFRTGRYRCVVTQEELHHQIHAETFVFISGSEFPWGRLLVSGFLGLVLGWFTFGTFILVAPEKIFVIVSAFRRFCPAGKCSASEAAEFKPVLRTDADVGKV